MTCNKIASRAHIGDANQSDWHSPVRVDPRMRTHHAYSNTHFKKYALHEPIFATIHKFFMLDFFYCWEINFPIVRIIVVG